MWHGMGCGRGSSVGSRTASGAAGSGRRPRCTIRRAERLWLVIAVATLWTVSVGCQAEVALPAAVLTDLPAQHVARRHSRGRSAARALSCFRRGRLVVIAALCSGEEFPLGRLVPEPWPKSLYT